MHRNMLCQPSFFDILVKDLRLCIFLKQMNAFSLTTDYDVKAGKKGNLAVSRRQAENKTISVGGNNRKKKYILDEGMDIPAFRELGIFTKEGKVVSSMYDKFRQINRFI